MKKFISLLTAGMLLLGAVSASAAETLNIQYDFSNPENAKTQITVSGQLASGKANEEVSVTLYTAEDELAGVTEVVSEAGGAYTATIELSGNAASGAYTVRIGAAGVDTATELPLSIATAGDMYDLITAVNNSTSAAELETAMEPAYADEGYGLQFDVFDLLDDKTDAYELLYSYKESLKDGLDPEDVPAFEAAFQQASVLAALNEGKEFALEDHFALFPNANQDICADYTGMLTEDGRAAALDMLSGLNLTNADDFCTGLEDAVVLAAISYPAKYGYAHIQEALTRYEAIFTARGFDINAYKNGDQEAIASELVGTYTSMSVFKSAFDAAVDGGNQGGNSGNPGGGSGGGSGSGSGSSWGSGGTTITGGDSTQTPLPTLPFTDMDTVPWAADAIIALHDKGIIEGVGDGQFQPNNNILREEFAKILTLAFGLTGTAEPFSDMEADAWYASYVGAMRANGITNGQEDGTFGVGRDITRAEVAAMVYRTVQYQGIVLPEAEVTAFADSGEIAAYAQDAVSALAAAGVINGKGDGKFYPNDAITRAEAAKMIYNVLSFTSEEGNQ